MSQRHPDDDLPGAGHGDEIPDLPPEWAGMVVPDDARELDAEVAEYRREQRLAQRRARVERVFKTRRWRRHGLSGPLIALVLVVVAFFGSLVLLLPSPPQSPRRGPLAKPSVDPGQVGGLLPALTLPEARGTQVAIRDVRPAVVALVPRGCGCRKTVLSLIDQTQDSRVRVLIVSGADSATLPLSAPANRVDAVADPNWTVGQAYHASMNDVTALLVRANGLVTRELPDVQPGPTLHEEIVELVGS